MPLDDQIEDMNSSNVSDLDEQAITSKPEAVVDDAASSPATGENTQETDLLSVVRDVVKDSRGVEAASPTASSEENGQANPDQPKKADDENYSDVPFNKHPRFQHLLRKAKTYEQDAGRYQNVVGFLDEHGLSAEEAADGLEIMALSKTNPTAAWEKARPWLEKLVVAAGAVLPPELHQRVEKGELSAEAAQEIAKANAKAASMEAHQSFRQQREERQQQESYVRSLTTAAEDWQADRQAKDPNFAAKFPLIHKEVLFLHATEGKPNTPEGVKAQLKKAYEAVNATFRPPQQPVQQQRRPATRPVTGGQVAGNHNPAQKSGDRKTMDIVNDVISRRAG